MNRRVGHVCWLAFALVVALGGAAAGAQDAADDLTIVISSPGEGETFYTSGSFLLSMPISGRVFSYSAPLDPKTVRVTLELVDAAGERDTQTVRLDDRGFFNARATMLSHTSAWPSDDPHAEMVCGECHQPIAGLALPVDVTHLVVTARAEDGRSGQTTRSMQFDHGTPHLLNVTVEGLPADSRISAQVSATTLIYEWRRRTFYSPVVDGQAALTVEGLTHADLTYEVFLPPVILNETRYVAPAQTVIVRAGQEAAPVTLVAQPTRGSIAGQVVKGMSAGAGVSAEVLVVDLNTGAGRTAQAGADGRFALDDLPVAEHALLARAAGGFHLPPRFDLVKTAAVETTVHLMPAGAAVLQGRVLLDGRPLPFAQATAAGMPAAHADPLTGAFALDGVDADGALETEIAAAGCYGAAVSSAARDLGDISLTVRPDTRVVERDGWRLYIPHATRMTEANGAYSLASGVFWVTGADSASGPAISARGFSLQGRGADFSVEDVAGAQARLYVSQGDVLVTRAGWGEPLTVSAGQTLTLAGEQPRPADLVPGAGALLRQIAGPVARFELAPSAAAQQSAAVSGLVTAVAQVFIALAAFITYVVMPGLLIGGGVYFVYRRWRAAH